MFQNLGSDIYKSWSSAQRKEEIGKLVQGYRAGLPIEILCTMAESIAGSRSKARRHIAAFIPKKEREEIAAAASDKERQDHLRSFLL
jgi:hypothetical protein